MPISPSIVIIVIGDTPKLTDDDRLPPVGVYFNKTGVYLGAGIDLNRYRMKGGHSGTEWGLGIEAGYAYFLSKTVTIEPAVYYKWRFNDSDLSKFGIKIGFGFYF